MQQSPKGVAPNGDDAEGDSFADTVGAGRTPLSPFSKNEPSGLGALEKADWLWLGRR